jgi:hypothetical protein
MIAQTPSPAFAKAVFVIIVGLGYIAAAAAFLYPVLMYIRMQ